jgi:ADP-heptose:LPS heptosyltransferase
MHAKGDVLYTLPVIREMKRRWRDAQITVVTEHPELFTRNPDVMQAQGGFNGSAIERFDRFFDLDMAYENRPNMHVIDAYADACGLKVEDYKPVLYPLSEHTMLAFADMPVTSRWVVMHPGKVTGWVGRQWPPERFSMVAKVLQQEGFRIALVGDLNTPAIEHDLDRRSCALHQLWEYLRRADLFVGVNSMPMNLAMAAGTPAVGIFGSVSPDVWLLPEARAIAVTAPVGCLGCHRYLPAPRMITDHCIRGREVCLERVTPEMVLDAAHQLLEKEKR